MKRMATALLFTFIAAIPGKGFGQTLQDSVMKLTSEAFRQGDAIPDQYTCKGKNISPSLSWSGAPEETKSFALIVEDPDASRGVFTHWVVYNIDPEKNTLPAALGENGKTEGLMQGQNDFEKTGYGGPCPPAGNGPHHYFFRLYALDTVLDLQPGADKVDVKNTMDNHVLAQAELMGLYEVK